MTTAIAKQRETAVACRIEALQLELKSPAMKAELATAAEMIVGAYPQGKPSDPDRYVRSVVALLSTYPRFVVQAVADPRTGVVARCRFLPSVAEIKDVAEAIRRPKADELAHHRAVAKQVQERTEDLSDDDRAHLAERMEEFRKTLKAKNPSGPKEPEKTVGEELKELKGAAIVPSPTQSQSGQAIRDHEGWNVRQKQQGAKDAISNADTAENGKGAICEDERE